MTRLREEGCEDEMHPVDEGTCDSYIVIDTVPVRYCFVESCLLDSKVCWSRPVESPLTVL